MTIDLDTTDVEVYGRKKRGVADNHQEQRCGRPRVATWAQTATVVAADLMAGTEDPARTPRNCCAGHSRRCQPRRGPGGSGCARTRATSLGSSPAPHCSPTSSSRSAALRIAPLWRILNGVKQGDWVDAVDRDGAQVVVAEYCPDW